MGPNLRALDDSGVSRELDLASELFHRVNRIIPQDQELLAVPPTCRVRDAVALMHEHGYSQLPVVQDGQVLGVFSHRSFCSETAGATFDDLRRQGCAPGDLCVDEFLERFEFARVTEDMARVLDSMNRDSGVLIGTPERLVGILTPMDFLRYLYDVASPFVMVSEIELAVRALIRLALRDDQIAQAARRSLAGAYGGEGSVPTILEDMTFNNYQSLISHSDNWPQLESVFGGTRTRASGKLRQAGSIRNDLFHFRREITVEDHQTLTAIRDWLLSKIKQAEAHRATEAKS